MPPKLRPRKFGVRTFNKFDVRHGTKPWTLRVIFMRLRLTIAFLFILSVNQSVSQKVFTVERQQLKVLSFDTLTEPTFIYEVGNAILYFRQQDILDFISNSYKTKSYPSYVFSFEKLLDTLLFKSKKIRIKDNLYSFDSTEQVDSPSKNVLEINEEFPVAGADLILQGLFMLYSKEEKRFLTANLLAKRTAVTLGEPDLLFLLPNGQTFLSIPLIPLNH